MNTHNNTLPVLILKKVVHRKKVVLAIIFRFNHEIKEQIKEIGGYSFSRTLKAWTIEYSEENLSTLKAKLNKKVVFEEDRNLQQVVLKRYVKEKRNLSEESKTVVRNYVKYLKGNVIELKGFNHHKRVTPFPKLKKLNNDHKLFTVH